MNKHNISAAILGVAATAFTLGGLTSCDTGTSPGETNVERSDIRDEGEMVGEEGEQPARYDEADSLESHYDHADHENHDDNTNKALGDGAYDGKGDGVKRDEVKQ